MGGRRNSGNPLGRDALPKLSKNLARRAGDGIKRRVSEANPGKTKQATQEPAEWVTETVFIDTLARASGDARFR